MALLGSSQSRGSTLLPIDGDSAYFKPVYVRQRGQALWTGESGAMSALDAIQMARAAGAKLANTGIR
jgi:hypothetical protein